MSDWSDEETRDPLVADERNFYKVEKWTRDGTKVEWTLITAQSEGPSESAGAPSTDALRGTKATVYRNRAGR